jgi:hypothetical protein
VPRERDRIGDCGSAGADHQPVERQAGVAVGGHHALALGERERRRLAGGAEHVEAVAAVVEQEVREPCRARAIRLAARLERGGNRGDHARKRGYGHREIS